MKKIATLTTTILITALAAGCGTAADTSNVAAHRSAPEQAIAAPASAVALEIEQAETTLDVGHDAVKARTTLEAALRDPAATSDEHDEATMALSRALESAGDTEGAVRRVEELIRAHTDDRRWPMEQAVHDRLSMLLTGHDARGHRLRPDWEEEVAPIAHALTRYFPAQNDGSTQVTLKMIHGDDAVSKKLGTWNIGGALKAEKREACPLCDDTMNTHTWSSNHGSWTSIPAYGGELESSLAVFYFDLADGRIPERYDAELPMPSAEIAARLEKGAGLIVVKERPGSPPSIVIAAPREAQLELVEAVLAAMKTLPTEPVSVPLAPDLRPSEIQGVVRADGFLKYRACYKTLLATTPDAAGHADLGFKIRGDGTVEGAALGDAATLRDPVFVSCMLDATNALVFPATGHGYSTVKYPILMSPGDSAGR